MKQARILAAALLAGTLALASAGTATAAGYSVGSSASRVVTMAPVATGRVLVRIKGSASRSALSSLARSVDATIGGIGDMKTGGRFAWLTPKGKTDDSFAKELVATGKVDYASPVHVRQVVSYTPPAYVSPNDPMFTSTLPAFGYSDAAKTHVVEEYLNSGSWWLRDINAPEAWQEGYTGPGIIGRHPLRASGSAVTVYVLDSGLYSSHPDAGANIVGGVDYFDHQNPNGTLAPPDNDVTPVDWWRIAGSDESVKRVTAAHGTCVAGEIGATANNGTGTVGVAYDTRVVVDKVMGRYNNGTTGIDDEAVVDAILDATNAGAKVISMSFGGYDTGPVVNETDSLRDAINYARANGVVVVAAKGNDGKGTAFYPADYPGVVSVGALDKNANGITVPATFSNYYKTSHDIMAPGAFIMGLSEPGYYGPYSSSVGIGYHIWDGTSMAAPVVSGAIAWLWRAAPALSGAEITDVVLNSATPHGAATHFPSGYRALDMLSAYHALEAQYPLLTAPQLASQTLAGFGHITIGWTTGQSPVRGVTYDVSVNSTAVAGATPATSGQFPWTPGDYAVLVQAHSAYNWDDGTAITNAVVHVVDPATGASSWSHAHVAGGSATSAQPAYRTSVAIEATLRDVAGVPLCGASSTLWSSTNASSWLPVSDAAELPSGLYRATVAPESRTYYRLTFNGAGSVGGSASSFVVVTPRVLLSTPVSKTSLSHTKKLAVSGTLKPAHASGSRVVQLQVFRQSGKKWVAYSRAWTVVKSRGGYSSYSANLKLKKGGYRIYAYAPGDSRHSATTSGYRSVAIK